MPHYQQILDTLCSRVFKDHGLAYFVLDEKGRIRHWGGNLARLKIDSPGRDTQASDLLVFLEGLLPLETESMALSCIRLPSGVCVDAHLFRLESGHGLILFDSSPKEAMLAPVKQQVNELSLAIHEQKKVLARLSGKVRNRSPLTQDHPYLDFLQDCFLALNFAVLEMDNQGRFFLFGTPPPWMDMIPQAAQLLDGLPLEEDVFSFLGNFIQEVKERWDHQKFDRLKSGVWIETDAQGQEHLFEATAMVIHSKHLLIITNDVCAPDEKQAIIQKGRNLALNYTAMKQSGRKLQSMNDLLELRVRQRTEELEEANAKLSAELLERKKVELERTQALDQLRQSQKMEAIGTLAGGVAHDFNNILSAIIGFTELSLVENTGDERIQARLNKILKASNRAKKLVNQILTFSLQDDEDKEPIMLSRVVREVLSLIQGNLPRAVTLVENLESDAYILGDHTQMHQVVMNLCTNAWQAMEPRGGVLRVELTQTDADPGTGKALSGSGPYLLLKIQDTGNGIPPQAMEKLFDPYFTTKPDGTGLGLSVVLGIVSKSQGHIFVDTEPGKGSLFSLYFPVWRLTAE